MVPPPRIELGIDDYESTVIPLNYGGTCLQFYKNTTQVSQTFPQKQKYGSETAINKSPAKQNAPPFLEGRFAL